jgi:hypothetical protein
MSQLRAYWFAFSPSGSNRIARVAAPSVPFQALAPVCLSDPQAMLTTCNRHAFTSAAEGTSGQRIGRAVARTPGAANRVVCRGWATEDLSAFTLAIGALQVACARFAAVPYWGAIAAVFTRVLANRAQIGI